MDGKEGQERGWKGKREWKKKEKWEDEKRCQKERKQSKKGEDEQDKNTAMGHNFPAPRPLSPGAWPARDVSAPCRPRRPRPSVVKPPGTLVAAGRVGWPRSLGGCESLGLWPPAQAAPAAGQGGNCPETRRLSGRVVQGCASRTRGGGSHARLRARGLSASVLAGTFGRPVSWANAAGARRGHAKMLCAVPVCPPSVSPAPTPMASQDWIQTAGKGTCRQPRDPRRVKRTDSHSLTSTHMLWRAHTQKHTIFKM